MKLNWFSPLPPAPTGIAEYTATILPWLASHAEIVLWTDQERWDPSLQKRHEIRRYSLETLDWGDVNAADLSVFHLGNNPDFHDAIWHVSRRHAGVTVLHDLRLQDFFWGIFARKRNLPEQYVEWMETIYGAEACQAAGRVVQGTQSLGSLCLEYPLTEAAIENAIGVVVHTQGGFDVLSAQCRSSLAYLAFPYAPAEDRRWQRWQARARERRRPPFELAMFGYINPNRRIDTILQALGEIPAKESFRLRVYGPVWDEGHVRRKIREFGLERLVTLHGHTPTDALDEALAGADLAINLRFPTMGEASMSQLQVWDHALPSIVTRTGWYAGLPEDSVLFVNVERELEDLKDHLSAWARDPAAFSRMGQRGRATLIANHAPELYAADLMRYLGKVSSYRGPLAFEKAAKNAATDLNGWISPMAWDGAVNVLAKKTADLMGRD